MHGRPRKPLKPEDEAKSAVKADKLRSLQSQFLSNHHNKIYSEEALGVSAKLLETNPEHYTAWNYRKLAVEHRLSRSDSDPESVLDEELRLVENALRQNVKAYGAWHHRKWMLSRGPSSIEKELKLLDGLQDADARNFHAWNYRRFVADLFNRSEEDELEYTQNLIDSNFSNYSAWHNRSFLLSNLMKKKAEGFSKKDEVLSREYDLVRGAIFTDENDQGGWFYHLWLLDQTVKNEFPLLVSTWPANGSNIGSRRNKDIYCGVSGNLPIILYFNQPVEGVNSSTVTVSSTFNIGNDLIWKPISVNKSQTASVWVTQLDFPTMGSEPYLVEVEVGKIQGIVSSCGFQYQNPSQLSFTIQFKAEPDGGPSLENISWSDDNFLTCEPSFESDIFIHSDQLSLKNDNKPAASKWHETILQEEISNFRELPECKIGKLTLARLLMAYDALTSSNGYVHCDEVLKLYSELMKFDPAHLHFYKDMHSLASLHKVTSSKESFLRHCFHYKDLTSSSSANRVCLRLSKLSLSRIGSFEKLLWVQMLDLSYNELKSIQGIEAMQLLSYLNLSRNKISSFTALGPLRQLKSLKVLDVSHNVIGAHTIDSTRFLCSSPLTHAVDAEWGELAIDGMSGTDYYDAYFVLKGLNLTQIDISGNAIAGENFVKFLVKILPNLKWLGGAPLK